MPKREYNVELFSPEQLVKYHNDPKWARVKKLTGSCRFGEANALVLEIQKDHNCFNEVTV